MTRINLIVVPRLKRAAYEAITLIGSEHYEALFINLPRSLQPHIRQLIQTGDLDTFLSNARRVIVDESVLTLFLRGYEDFLRLLPRVSTAKEVICYSADPSETEIHLYREIPALTLRDSISAAISIDRWTELIQKMLESAQTRLSDEARFIALRAENYKLSACICNPESAASLKRILQKFHKARMIYTVLPYTFTPLQELLRTASRHPLTEYEIREGIERHIRFVRNFIIPKGLEEGLEKWIERESSWLRIKAHE